MIERFKTSNVQTGHKRVEEAKKKKKTLGKHKKVSTRNLA